MNEVTEEWVLPQLIKTFGDLETYCRECRTMQKVKLYKGVPTIICEKCKCTYVIKEDLSVGSGKRI